MTDDVFRAVTLALDQGEAAALVTIVSTGGSTPQRVGAKLLAYADGRVVGTIGGGCYENDALGRAREAIRLRQPQLVRYDLNDDVAGESGLICGGHMDVFIEPLEPAPHLYIIGAGHVGQDVARIAHLAGFQVHVLDDREAFANAERFPDAVELAVADIPGWLAGAALPARSYAVIVTRGHRYDREALRALAGRDLTYVGLIGSRAKVRKLFEALAADGVPAEILERVHAPVGLDLGAVTPAEIAVSIVAELVAARSGRLAEPHVAAATMRARR
ncbi:MAG: XdhC family protein [Acidobacteria bacterium]|nr:XdhC family protein [Acidobacteriota bacterium]